MVRNTGPISTKLGTKHPWVMGIQVCLNERLCPFPRGDDYEITKIHRRNSYVHMWIESNGRPVRYLCSINIR